MLHQKINSCDIEKANQQRAIATKPSQKEHLEITQLNDKSKILQNIQQERTKCFYGSHEKSCKAFLIVK